jgi:hypothetical protein
MAKRGRKSKIKVAAVKATHLKKASKKRGRKRVSKKTAIKA